jgi:hypothetical protein
MAGTRGGSVASKAWGALPVIARVRQGHHHQSLGERALRFVVIWPSHLRFPSLVFYAFDGVLVLVPFRFLSSISDFYDMIGQPRDAIKSRRALVLGSFAYEEQ